MDQAVQDLGRQLDALARDRARMEAILASMVEGVLVVDAQGRLQLVNEAARRMLKLEQGALDHSYVEAIRHPGIVDHIARALAGEQTEGLELSVTRDTDRTLVARVAPVEAAGRGAVLVMHDITDLRWPTRSAATSSPTCRTSCGRRSRRSRATPKRLLDDPDDAEARHRFLDIIHRQAARMERLVKDLLRLARLDAGQETVDLAPCDVRAWCAASSPTSSRSSREKQQRVETHIAPDARHLSDRPREAARRRCAT